MPPRGFRQQTGDAEVRAFGFLQRHAGLACVLLIALAARLVYLRWFKAFPPGDVFNFINIAQGLPEGTYPPNERRLPFYPLLTLLAHSVLDWETATLFVAVAASLAALVALYALGRTLGLSKTALAVLLLVFQTQPQVLTATRGYADTTLFALLPITLLALFRTRTWKGAVLTGALCGALALTRYEGLAAALVLLPLWFLFPGRQQPRRFALIGALAFALSLVPYLLLSAANGRPAFGAGYIAEAEGRSGYGAGNAREFWESELAIWKRTGLLGAWEIPFAIAREIGSDPFAAPRILTARLVEPGEPLALLALLGALFFLQRRQWRGLLFPVAVTAAASVPPAWFNPLPRYDIVLFPLLVLLAASGVSAIQRLLERATQSGGRAGTAVRFLAGAVFVTAAAGLWMVAYAEDVRNRQTKHNGRDYAYYQAIHAARALPGTIGFDRDPDIVRLYFGDRAVNLRKVPADGESPEAALARVRKHGIGYLVLPSPGGQPVQAVFLALPDITLVQPYAWPRGDGDISRAAIYRVE